MLGWYQLDDNIIRRESEVDNRVYKIEIYFSDGKPRFGGESLMICDLPYKEFNTLEEAKEYCEKHDRELSKKKAEKQEAKKVCVGEEPEIRDSISLLTPKQIKTAEDVYVFVGDLLVYQTARATETDKEYIFIIDKIKE